MRSDKFRTFKCFDFRRLKPFRREGVYLPGTDLEEEDKISQLDPNLKPEEHSYVNHYVNYADVLLEHGVDVGEDNPPVQEPPEEDKDGAGIQEPPAGNVVEIRQRVKIESKQPDQPEEDGRVA